MKAVENERRDDTDEKDDDEVEEFLVTSVPDKSIKRRRVPARQHTSVKASTARTEQQYDSADQSKSRAHQGSRWSDAMSAQRRNDNHFVYREQVVDHAKRNGNPNQHSRWSATSHTNEQRGHRVTHAKAKERSSITKEPVAQKSRWSGALQAQGRANRSEPNEPLVQQSRWSSALHTQRLDEHARETNEPVAQQSRWSGALQAQELANRSSETNEPVAQQSRWSSALYAQRLAEDCDVYQLGDESQRTDEQHDESEASNNVTICTTSATAHESTEGLTSSELDTNVQPASDDIGQDSTSGLNQTDDSCRKDDAASSWAEPQGGTDFGCDDGWGAAPGTDSWA